MSLELLGKGIYTIPEASRLSKISQDKIKRWINGYETARKRYTPIFKPDYRPINHRYAVSFLDLVELRFIDEFRRCGVKPHIIRSSWLRAKEISGSAHPFATLKFRTTGKFILADEGANLLELTRNQLEWTNIVNSYLIGGLEFDGGLRWWPLKESRRVVVDPQRRFGKPILHDSAVPTRAIANAYNVNGSIDEVANWFQVDDESVRDAIEFENQLAA
jgi:uncharacterized protein (DUF433 family)